MSFWKSASYILALAVLAGCATVSEMYPQSHEAADDPAYPKEARPVPTAEERSAALLAITNYQFGENREALTHLNDLVTAALPDEAAAAAFSTELAVFLHTPASHDAKVYVCRQWARIGQAADAATVADLLSDARLAEMARYALEPVPGDAVDEELIEALAVTEGTVRIGIINSLGERGSELAVPALEALAKGDNAEAAAAQVALKKIGD